MQVNPAVALVQVAKFAPQATQAPLLKKNPEAHWVARTLLEVGATRARGHWATLDPQATQTAALFK
jgi:hypothetical protein